MQANENKGVNAESSRNTRENSEGGDSRKQKASRSLRAAGLLLVLLSTEPVLILKEAG
jgi:hypothetical protein